MSDIVKYHNDFNKIKLPSFTELEQNLLCAMFLKIKENEKEEIIKFPVSDLRKIALQSNLKDKEQFKEIMKSLFYKFFKADFTILIKDEKGRTGETFINLFKKVIFWNNEENEKLLEEIELKINPDFAYLVISLTKEFTSFELTEFIALSGKYTKTLYRLLKQYRTTGKVYFEWEEFKRIMDISEKMRMCDIDKDILKPAIKELTKERNLFDQIRIPFKNLAYEKDKAKSRGRGGKVIGITFTFKPENVEMQKLENKALNNASEEEKILNTCNNMCQAQMKFEYENKIYKTNSYDFDKLVFYAIELSEDDFGNTIPVNHKSFKCENKEQFFKMIKTFSSNLR